MQTTFTLVAEDHFIEARFINWNLSFLQTFDFCLVHIHARHIHAHFGKACAAYESYITSTDNRNIHINSENPQE